MAVIVVAKPAVTGHSSLAPVTLAVLVVALQFPTELFMMRNYALAVVFLPPLIMLMTILASPVRPARLLTHRAIETIGGALIGVAMAGAARYWDRTHGTAS